MTIDLLITAENCRPTLDAFREKFEVHFLPDAPDELDMLDKIRPKIRAILTSTSYGATREFIESFPALEIICCFGAGYDGLNIEAIRDRNLAFTTAVGTNADGVADLALAHILACTRRIPMADNYVRSERWATEGRLPLRHSLSEKHLGIIGLGAIGSRVAKRAEGFGKKIAYTGPNQKNVPYAFEEKLIDLAHFADFLVACCPGGPTTHGIVSRDVLVALGPNGTFINVDRSPYNGRIRCGGTRFVRRSTYPTQRTRKTGKCSVHATYWRALHRELR